MNPLADTFRFLSSGGWPIYTFWPLLVGSTAIALASGDMAAHLA